MPTPTFSSPLAKKNKKILRNELERKGGRRNFCHDTIRCGCRILPRAIFLCRPVGDSEEKYDEGAVESAYSTANNKLAVSRDVVNI